MKNHWKRGIACLLVIALVAVLCVGCGDDKKDGKVTITIGQITDMTGPASTAVIYLYYVTEDILRYYNEGGLIPGVELKLITYDNNYNFAKDIPGYDWCRDRGAEVILATLPPTAELLKPFAQRDKVPIVTASTSHPMMEPPGWVFAVGCPFGDQVKTILKWIGEEHWDYSNGIAKVGFVGWSQPSAVELSGAVGEYCQDHPDKFELVDSFLVPVGTQTFSGEVEKLKDCDYVFPSGYPAGFFMREFRSKGYDATFFGESTMPAYKGFFMDLCGWEVLDGFLTGNLTRWWDEPYPRVDLAEELLYNNHPGKAEEIIYAGSCYVGGFANVYPLFQILQKAIEEVGAENFDGQAFYDAAINFEVQWEGYPKWSITETKRYMIHDLAIYEWSAEAEDLVRVSDWLPLVTE